MVTDEKSVDLETIFVRYFLITKEYLDIEQITELNHRRVLNLCSNLKGNNYYILIYTYLL